MINEALPSRWIDAGGETHVAAGGLRRSSYLSIEGRECTIYLETLPHDSCRGNYVAFLDARGALLETDDLVGFPCYFFDIDRAKLELEAWLKKRGQWVS